MNKNKLRGFIVDDHRLFREGVITLISEFLKVDTLQFGDGLSALKKLNSLRDDEDLDFIMTDINHPNINGQELINRIRKISDHKLYYNGLKLKYVPIVVLTMHDSQETIAQIKDISSEIIYLFKDSSVEDVVKAIVKSVASYRKALTEELTNTGHSIQFQSGKYVVTKTFDLKSNTKNKYFGDTPIEADKAVARTIIIRNSFNVAKVSLLIFEDMINNKKTSERDFHDFFRQFPEFLPGYNFDVLHSESILNDIENKKRIDIMAQPLGLANDPDKWMLIELKKHTENILTDKKYHANFSKRVYNAITQLKNYSDYFSNERNFDEIRKKFGGIKPNPKLTLLIGRTPKGKQNLFSKEKGRFPDISIVTYDEILEFRKIQLGYMDSLYS